MIPEPSKLSLTDASFTDAGIDCDVPSEKQNSVKLSATRESCQEVVVSSTPNAKSPSTVVSTFSGELAADIVMSAMCLLDATNVEIERKQAELAARIQNLRQRFDRVKMSETQLQQSDVGARGVENSTAFNSLPGPSENLVVDNNPTSSANAEKGINDLPNEMQHKILSHLSKKDFESCQEAGIRFAKTVTAKKTEFKLDIWQKDDENRRFQQRIYIDSSLNEPEKEKLSTVYVVGARCIWKETLAAVQELSFHDGSVQEAVARINALVKAESSETQLVVSGFTGGEFKLAAILHLFSNEHFFMSVSLRNTAVYFLAAMRDLTSKQVVKVIIIDLCVRPEPFVRHVLDRPHIEVMRWTILFLEIDTVLVVKEALLCEKKVTIVFQDTISVDDIETELLLLAGVRSIAAKTYCNH